MGNTKEMATEIAAETGKKAQSLKQRPPRLGVCLDQIAALRELRDAPYPDLLEAARCAKKGGADQITVHLRQDRKYVQDGDVKNLQAELAGWRDQKITLNLQMAALPASVRFATRIRPDWVCLVPEKRQEDTPQRGLDFKKDRIQLGRVISQLKKEGIKVSCLIDPGSQSVRMSQQMGADAVEIYTGLSATNYVQKNFEKIKDAAQVAAQLGIPVHAGNGLNYENIRLLAELERADRSPMIEEYNIGHSIACRAVFVGLESAVREMFSAIYAP